MTSVQHLNRAPIREAIIDIRIAPSVNIEVIRKVADALEKDFSRVEEMRRTAFGFSSIKGEVKASANDEGLVGFRLIADGSAYVLGMAVDRFTFSKLPPYEDWETMRDKARSYWVSYLDNIGPSTVVSCSTRFINAMEFPLPVSDLGQYLSSPPQIPAELPQEISSFFYRTILNEREIGAGATLTLALEEIINNKAPIIFDINVFKKMDIEAISPVVWDTLENLRTFKNKVFFSSITQKAAEMFECQP
jgi:uncharacterized protein (TIGR04255 family)